LFFALFITVLTGLLVALAPFTAFSNVLQLVLGDGFKIVATGVFVGIAASFALTRLMRSLLYAVGPNDPLTFAVIAVLFALVALAACYMPARHAAHVDPMVALRYE